MYLSRVFLPVQRRSFVSTVLLSRTWENETVVELRKEARARGLSVKGNKSSLIARIQEHEEKSVTSPPLPSTTRSASTKVPPTPSRNTLQATSPGIPLAAKPVGTSTHADFLAIKLPKPSQPSHNVPVQVPYVPDFWNSAQPKADPPLELERPKLHVVGGSATHYDGGPTYNLEKLEEDGSTSATAQDDHPPAIKEVGLWPEFCASLGLPRSFSPRRTLSDLAARGKIEPRIQSRPLTDEERKGLYILLGVVAGSWLVGGLVN